MATEGTRGVQGIDHRMSSVDMAVGTDASENLRPWTPAQRRRVNMRRVYEMLELYAANNSLYDTMLQAKWKRGEAMGDVRGLVTPANAVVQAYASTVWPGTLPDALPIVASEADEAEPLRAAIHALWDASNWSSEKQVTVRHAVRLGNVFLKAAQRDDGHPYIQVIHPWYVSDFDTNERGNITMIRLDMPQEVEDEHGRTLIETELWEKGHLSNDPDIPSSPGRHRIWLHFEDLDADIDKLGEPEVDTDYTKDGFDFIPYVLVRARDVGEKYGQAPILPALDKIDEMNMLATELHDDMFRHGRAKWAISSNMLDSEGRPMVPPGPWSVPDEDGISAVLRSTSGDEYYVLPGMASMNALGTGIDWNARIAVRDSAFDMLAKTDLPELRWYMLAESSGSLSGVALRRFLSPAVSAFLEVRGNMESGLIKVVQMCLTLGKLSEVEPFAQLTAWEESGLRFKFAERDIIPVSEDERADADMKRQQANALMIANGYSTQWVMTNVDGIDEDEALEMLAERQRTEGPTVSQDLAALRARLNINRLQNGEPPEVTAPAPADVTGSEE